MNVFTFNFREVLRHSSQYILTITRCSHLALVVQLCKNMTILFLTPYRRKAGYIECVCEGISWKSNKIFFLWLSISRGLFVNSEYLKSVIIPVIRTEEFT